MSKKPKTGRRPPRSRSYVMSRARFAVPTDVEIDSAMTCKGMWTAETLRGWGIAYPLPKGWRARLRALSQAGHTHWLGWYLDQKAQSRQRADHSEDAVLRGMMGMGT